MLRESSSKLGIGSWACAWPGVCCVATPSPSLDGAHREPSFRHFNALATKIARTIMQRGTRARFPEILVTSRPAHARLLACALVAAAGLTACSGDFNPVRDVAVKTGMGAERKEGPD